MKKVEINRRSLVLLMLLLISCLFKDIYTTIGNNLNINLGIIIYSFTFLETAIIFNKYKMRETKKTILICSGMILLFYLIVSALCLLNIHDSEMFIALKDSLVPNTLSLGNLNIYYPDINVLFLLIVFILTHYIFIITYEIIEDNSNKLTSFILALLIAFILDQSFYTLFNNIYYICINSITYIDMIKELTGRFFIVVLFSVITSLIYPLCFTNKKKTHKK